MLKNLTVGKKIILGFSLLIMLAIFVGGIGTWKAGNVEEGVDDLHGIYLPITLLLAQVSDSAGKQELAATMYALHGRDHFVDDFNRYDALADSYFKKIDDLINTDSDLQDAGWLQLNEKLAQRHDAFVEADKQLLAAQGRGSGLIEEAADLVEKRVSSFNEELDKFNEINKVAIKEVTNSVFAESHSSKIWMLTISVVILFVGAFISIFLARAITKPLGQAINDINEGAVQVAAASEEVASASQHLAEGASEQAAGLEETSSSLEEMTSMTKQNAENAGQANVLMNETIGVVDKANSSMAQLTTSMSEVTKASEDTSKIIKTIDEIAFQTNLLALNAAVEAARAGEAGAGFAVVADEVRNLAMRAATAAKDTAGLIEGTVKQVHESTILLQATNEDFGGVAQISKKVSNLINEISSASEEQSRGIDQISSAVLDMDRVTQQNAATAEESASASEELSAQSEVMRSTVQGLAVLVGGAVNPFAVQNATAGLQKSRREQRPTSHGHLDLKKPSPQRTKVLPAGQGGTDAKHVIPMEDDEFQDF